MRSLTFASGQYVDCGSAASLDNLCYTGGAMTVWAEIYRTGDGSNQHLFVKDNVFPSGWIFMIDNLSAEGNLRLLVPHTTTMMDYISNSSNVVALNTWTFVAATFDAGVTPQGRVYMGSATSPLAEVSGYTNAIDGVGTMYDDAAHNVYIGNVQRATAYPFFGRIGPCGVLNRALTVGELQQLQFSKRRNRAGCVLLPRLGGNGTSTQPDFSGNGNTGTVTGATVSDGPPSRHR